MVLSIYMAGVDTLADTAAEASPAATLFKHSPGEVLALGVLVEGVRAPRVHIRLQRPLQQPEPESGLLTMPAFKISAWKV